jgi:hypothetical protein
MEKKPSDHVYDALAGHWQNNASNAGAERSADANVLAIMIQRDYPHMSWQDCQSRAGQAVSYRR